MGDELRVTVVATGLGRKEIETEAEPFRPSIVEPTTGRPNYDNLDKPTIIRKGGSVAGEPTPAMSVSKESDGFDVLDIPAFLRRQAD